LGVSHQQRVNNEEFSMSRIIVSVIATTTLLCLSACNTTAGAGKDLKSAGKTIEKTAEKAK
jgi:predicted small secreted protein